MSGFRIEGNTSGNLLEVTNNNEVKVIGPNSYNANRNPSINGGFVNNIFEADSGSITGYPLQRQGDISANYRQRVGVDTLLFKDNFNGNAINTTLWTTTSMTMTSSVSSGFLTLNSGSSTANGTLIRVQTWRGFPSYGSYPLQGEFELVYASSAYQANNVTELGFGFTTGSSTPTDGAFFRYYSGQLVCVVNYNGSETYSSVFTGEQLPEINKRHHYSVVIGNDYVEFWIDNVLYANIPVPVTNGMALINQNTPAFIRTYNNGITSSAVQVKVSNVSVTIGDMNTTKSWRDLNSGMGGHLTQGQTGMTLGTTANYVNSSNPPPAVPTNTTAALGNGLGGQFWSTATLAVNTDGIISSYQIPALSATAPTKTLYITHIRIDTIVKTVLAGGPFLLQWGLAYGGTAVSLATIEAATTKAFRRLPLGFQVFNEAAAVGTQGTVIDFTLETPIAVFPGEFINTFYKNIGTVGTSGTFAHLISFDGYWE